MYVLTGEGAGSIFVIDANSGDLHATKSLDREEKPFYTLRAQAVNKKTGIPLEPETEFIVKLHDVNDNEPKFDKEVYTASVPERSHIGKILKQALKVFWAHMTYINIVKVIQNNLLLYIVVQNKIVSSYFSMYIIFLSNKCVQNNKCCYYLLSLMSFHIEKLTQKLFFSIQFN